MDDTLYPLSLGINLACRKNIEEFMVHQLYMEESEVPRLCLELYRDYGTTMAGLKIFTNADEAHVAQVLSRMGLEDCFQGVICFETLNPPAKSGATQILCKPSVEAMQAAIRIANVDPETTIFFDDSVRNIANGKAAGLHTVVVGRSSLVPGADYALNSIHNIREAMPEIWEDEGEHVEQIIQSSAVETAVQAKTIC
ncbi:UNVERIFIED_CONTAM: hypothetical protein Sradi_1824800 [Sesamum radiatum]|uniref:Uncharacterized protein n=1 Tax=Sesamum radiatum TaxID=300843 RepID=A0AAW2TWP2_SESRA